MAKKRKATKLKPVYLIPLVVAIIACLVFLSVLEATKSDGPVYGDRCAGVPEISQEVIDSTISQAQGEKAYMEELSITVDCKTVNISVTCSEGLTYDDAHWVCGYLLKMLDANANFEKTNENSAYSDLFGMSNGKYLYHVNFIVDGPEDHYPVFGTKHPASDTITCTYDNARDPALAEKLLKELEEERAREEAEAAAEAEAEAENTEETSEDTTEETTEESSDE